MWCGAQAARSIFKTLITEVAPTYMAGMGANKKGEGFEYQTFNPSAARLAAMSVHHVRGWSRPEGGVRGVALQARCKVRGWAPPGSRAGAHRESCLSSQQVHQRIYPSAWGTL